MSNYWKRPTRKAANLHHKNTVEIDWPCAPKRRIRTAVRWTPERKERTSKTTWRRTAEIEIEDTGYSQRVIESLARDRLRG